MKQRSLLESDLLNLGLSEDDARSHLSYLGEETEAGVEDDFEMEEEFEDEEFDGDEFDEEDLDEDDLDEAMRIQRMKKGTAKQRRASKQYYKAHKAQIARGMKRKRKTSAYKRHMAKLAKAPKAGGARTRRVVSDRETPVNDMHEDILESLGELAESMDREPVSRFDEYVEAFNSIADIGELLCLRVIDESNDSDEASEVFSFTVFAEDVLREMEEMGGALTPEEDAELEEMLGQAMEEVEEALEEYGMFEDEDEDVEFDEFDEDEDFDFEDEDELDEAKGARKVQRKKPAVKRLAPKISGHQAVGGKSNYAKKNVDGTKQSKVRKDWKDKKAMQFFLAAVKKGKAIPGKGYAKHIDSKGRKNVGAARAKAAAGK